MERRCRRGRLDRHAVLLEQVGEQGGGGRLAVCAGHRQQGAVGGDASEEFRPFEDGEPGLAQPDEEREVLRHGRCADDGPAVRAAGVEVVQQVRGQGVFPTGGVHGNAFGLQGSGERGGCAVMAGHGRTVVAVPPGEGAHPDAADAEEIELVRHPAGDELERTDRTWSTTRSAASGRAVLASASESEVQASLSSRARGLRRVSTCGRPG